MYMDETEMAVALADLIYARRCDEHVRVLCDCPKMEKDCIVRSIPPYCGEWCDLMEKPIAKLKDKE